MKIASPEIWFATGSQHLYGPGPLNRRCRGRKHGVRLNCVQRPPAGLAQMLKSCSGTRPLRVGHYPILSELESSGLPSDLLPIPWRPARADLIQVRFVVVSAKMHAELTRRHDDLNLGLA